MAEEKETASTVLNNKNQEGNENELENIKTQVEEVRIKREYIGDVLVLFYKKIINSFENKQEYKLINAYKLFEDFSKRYIKNKDKDHYMLMMNGLIIRLNGNNDYLFHNETVLMELSRKILKIFSKSDNDYGSYKDKFDKLIRPTLRIKNSEYIIVLNEIDKMIEKDKELNEFFKELKNKYNPDIQENIDKLIYSLNELQILALYSNLKKKETPKQPESKTEETKSSKDETDKLLQNFIKLMREKIDTVNTILGKQDVQSGGKVLYTPNNGYTILNDTNYFKYIKYKNKYLSLKYIL